MEIFFANKTFQFLRSKDYLSFNIIHYNHINQNQFQLHFLIFSNQESLRENSDEDENFIPELPQGKDLTSRYKKYEKPKLVRRKSEKLLQDFNEKHKKLTAAFNQTKQMLSDKAMSKSPSITSERSSDGEQPPTPSKEDSKSKRKSSIPSMKHLEDAIFKGIESLNSEVARSDDEKSEKSEDETPKISNINLLSTTIDETFENILDTLPSKEIKTATQPIKARDGNGIYVFADLYMTAD